WPNSHPGIPLSGSRFTSAFNASITLFTSVFVGSNLARYPLTCRSATSKNSYALDRIVFSSTTFQLLPFHSQNSPCQNLSLTIIAGLCQYLRPTNFLALSSGASLSRTPFHSASS